MSTDAKVLSKSGSPVEKTDSECPLLVDEDEEDDEPRGVRARVHGFVS